ncbi:MAG: tagaturonate epimerase family protein, partial [Bacteroidota bacterium]
SINKLNGVTYFIGKEGIEKSLYLLAKNSSIELSKFEGTLIESEETVFKKCPLTNQNRISMQLLFSFTIPQVLGAENSFGFGDRLGLANGGHIRSLTIGNFKPILAQQSIRELTRTKRTADEVMDAAVWAVFQEGYKSGFGSDADHLKTPDDIVMMLKAGFTMFTFDPGEHVDNNADAYDEQKLYSVVANLPWSELNDTFPAAERRYSNKEFIISDDFVLEVNEQDFLRAYAKYGKAISHIKKMYEHLKSISGGSPFEVEVSVDETESVTSAFEHFFFASELHRLKVEFVSLAPRFIGSFEKGIDYKGDLELFEREYVKHLAITKHFGKYKISLHSGSDKFSVYKVIGSLRGAHTHVKTAGTSYLEALRVVAAEDSKLFREIYDFCFALYETEKLSYHVSANLGNLKMASAYSEQELLELFNSDDARQVLHVTFGKVLTERTANGYLFKDKILNCLKVNEKTHYTFLTNHFIKHIEPFC